MQIISNSFTNNNYFSTKQSAIIHFDNNFDEFITKYIEIMKEKRHDIVGKKYFIINIL